MSIARNIALGNGITIDGKIETNGFQPLYTFLTVPAFWVSGDNRLEAMRVVFILSVLFYFATAFLIGKITQKIFSGDEKTRSISFWIGFITYLTSVLIFLSHFNGLETGVLLFFYTLVLHYLIKNDVDSYKQVLILGVLLGLLVLIRIDTVFFTIIVAISFFFKKELVFKKKLIFFFIIGITAFVVSSPWWLYNFINFGSIMPTSGTAQSKIGFTTDRLFYVKQALLQNIIPYINFANRVLTGNPLSIIQFVAVLLSIFLTWKIFMEKYNTNFSNIYFRRVIKISLLLIVSIIILSLWYSYTSLAVWFYSRYLIPISIIGVLWISFILVSFSNKYKKFILSFILILSLLFTSLIFILHFRVGIQGSEFYNHQLALIKKYIPDESTPVSAAQTGTLGFFRENVVNLDGKVNPEVLKFNNRIEYLEHLNIHWFCDWAICVKDFLGENPEKFGWSKIDSSTTFYLYHKN